MTSKTLTLIFIGLITAVVSKYPTTDHPMPIVPYNGELQSQRFVLNNKSKSLKPLQIFEKYRHSVDLNMTYLKNWVAISFQ